MTRLSPHFIRSEFACPCGCGCDTVDAELLTVLEAIRNFFGLPVTISSGIRCPTHNDDIGGVGGSQHMTGKAADFTVMHHTPARVHEYLVGKYLHKYGIGNYQRWTHIDVRPIMARW